MLRLFCTLVISKADYMMNASLGIADSENISILKAESTGLSLTPPVWDSCLISFTTLH